MGGRSVRFFSRMEVKARIHVSEGEKFSECSLGRYKARQLVQVTQHWRSCDDFGACLPQSFCGPLNFICAQQLDFAGVAMAAGVGIAVNANDKARRPAKRNRPTVCVMP
jgi:hypothetical protein